MSRSQDIADDLLRRERELAWIGDAVLGLFARRWILKTYGRMDSDLFAGMTSNLFLSCFGNPTTIEAQIGAIYESAGLDEAFAHLERDFIPLFLKQQKNRERR